MSGSLNADFWNDVMDTFWQETWPIVDWLIEQLVSDGQVVGDQPLDSDVKRVMAVLGLQQTGAADMLPTVNPSLAEQLNSEARRASERLMGTR